jgi:hypothetical protein
MCQHDVPCVMCHHKSYENQQLNGNKNMNMIKPPNTHVDRCPKSVFES